MDRRTHTRQRTSERVAYMIRGRTKTLLALIIAVALVGAGSMGMMAQPPAEDAVAKVNGEVITERELYEELVNRSGREVLEQMLTERLMKQAVDAAGIEVADEDIQAEMERVKSQLPEGVSVEDALAAAGMTEEQWMDEIRLDISLRTLLMDRFEVTEEEMQAFFEEYKEFFGTEEQVRVRHILVRDEEEAQALREQLEDGADFAELAREKSADRASAIQGGDLGWVTRGQMVKAFEDMAFSTKVGELSPVFETDFGYHILVVEARQEAEEAAYEDHRESVRAFLVEDKLQEAFRDWLMQVRDEADIEIYL